MIAPARQRGVALILALWLLVLMIALVGAFARSSRIEALQAHQLHSAVIARQAARAGIEFAAVHLLYADVDRRWVPDGRSYGLQVGGANVVIHVVDESGKVAINSASPDLLHKLLLAVGLADPDAQALAAAIVDYRDPDNQVTPGGAESAEYRAAGLPYGPKNKPFESISELQRVLGMNPALYEKLRPYVTVYGNGDPNPAFAQGPVLQALGMSADSAGQFLTQRQGWQPGAPGNGPVLPGGQPLLAQAGSGTYDISSQAKLADGTTITLDAIVRASQPGPFGQLYVPLQWRQGDSF
ncbi:MAG: general secretion pathway protein GspK [Proteobacteria bacterium]|nr:general secretion pathway protein GspK [Pseudomonadota bacterium]